MREWFGHARITDGSLCGTEAVDCLSYASDTMIGSPERRCTPPLADLQRSGAIDDGMVCMSTRATTIARRTIPRRDRARLGVSPPTIAGLSS